MTRTQILARTHARTGIKSCGLDKIQETNLPELYCFFVTHRPVMIKTSAKFYEYIQYGFRVISRTQICSIILHGY